MLLAMLLTNSLLFAENKVMKSNVNLIKLFYDGKEVKGGWYIETGPGPDVCETTAKEVAFVSDTDSINIVLDEWQSEDFYILTAEGDSALVRVSRIATDPFENPSPAIKKTAPSGLLSREQAEFDINALVYALSEIHPDMFSMCRQEDFFSAVNSAIASLPDSLSIVELYRKAAPIVSMIGDGHTNLRFPTRSFLTDEVRVMPLEVGVRTGKILECTASIDSVVPRGARILSINGLSAEEIVNAMIPFVSGEREHYKLARMDRRFRELYRMLFPADSYEVTYLPKGEKKTMTKILKSELLANIKKKIPKVMSGKRVDDYSFTVDSTADVAIMDFRSFRDVGRMKVFADSMFGILRDKNIGNLIIDIRKNSGGSSLVGDVLLSYITNEPFVQMDKCFERKSPLTAKLLGTKTAVRFYETTPDQLIEPLTAEEGHYNGKVYLLTSNLTFSSAGSFSWAFKQCNMGLVIGEETGGMNVCYGNTLSYKLPVSKLKCYISYKRFWQFKADGNDVHGTIPDIPVKAADALDTALELVRKNKR